MPESSSMPEVLASGLKRPTSTYTCAATGGPGGDVLGTSAAVELQEAEDVVGDGDLGVDPSGSGSRSSTYKKVTRRRFHSRVSA
jgi:hypothetical protein